MRITALFLCLTLTGCQTDFLGYGDDISTTSPTSEQIQYCREVMYINPELKIDPKGYYLQPGMDDIIRFKFTAKTDDPKVMFDSSQVDSSQYATGFNIAELAPNSEANSGWWDVGSKELTGANYVVPPPNSAGMRGLNVGYVNNEDGTLTVYVLWHET